MSLFAIHQFVAAQAVFLGIHGAMVRVDWSAWGFAYYATEQQATAWSVDC